MLEGVEERFQILADTPYQVVVLLYLLRDLLQLVADVYKRQRRHSSREYSRG